MTDVMLRADALSKSFGSLAANKDISFDVAAGSIHALIGPNGAGKSTAVNLLSGEATPDSGHIYFNGEDVSQLSTHARARLGLKRSYQITSLFTEFSALDNAMMAHIADAPHAFNFFAPARRDLNLKDRAMAALELLSIDDKANRPVAALSHGERRQLELAMVLATSPKMILLDEPMAGMGRGESHALIDVIKAVSEITTVLLVEHDMDVVFALADHISVLVKGEIIASGPPADIRADATVQAAYLGEAT